ncbi:CarboxypepD_reg-like domain-containing protein [Chryseobacterium vrystaatense]|uniref:CarboxypepD_reg-like domain-containing protein n=2 Tax=Chryseobacterium vrystaatense TaxID=307480 RepID=A0A1M5B905_9FLAO|nr:CarboxypepD_reg-like domain-containing protein [Chryseobacterium vrystaatense]
MKSSNLILGLMLLAFNWSLSQKIVEGQVLSEHNEPISYVNIGIINENTGTVSDINGYFKINIDNDKLNHLLTFSSPGFENYQVRINDIDETKDRKFLLSSKTIKIPEVIITLKNTQDVKLGTTSYSTMVAGYVRVNNDKNKDIQEFAKELNIKKPSKIKDIHMNLFNVIESDKRNFRVNIYDIKDGLPNNKINTENIIIDQKLQNGWNTFDVSSYHLVYDKPIFISIEYIPQIPGEPEPFRYSGKLFGKSITRNASLGKWQTKKGLTMSIYVTVAQ